MKLSTLKKVLTVTLGGILLIFLTGIILGFPTKLLWNWLMPSIFGLPEVTFAEALGLLVLAGLLFKNTNSKN